MFHFSRSAGNIPMVDAKARAQFICFAPAAFQATRVLRDRGLLERIHDARDGGLPVDDYLAGAGLAPYAARLLLEAAEALDLVERTDDTLHLTKTGYCILKDPMTRVNMDFMHDVCYQGMFHLEQALVSGKPSGLSVFGGGWKTIYEALASLPPGVRASWFAFDHYYSDNAFPDVLPRMFARTPRRILDIGGNTGRWAIACARHDPDVRITILDHPGQLEVASATVREAGFSDRIDFAECDLLDGTKPFPAGYDAVWMSQLLDCFAPDQIHTILTRARDAVSESGSVFVLETFVDRQRFKAAAFSLVFTSLYFTTMANGNSRMYSATDQIGFVEKAGLMIAEDIDGIGIGHTLLRCIRRES
jgi:ubiquinone/menaquinone biosynthesis C-methylase UbiE